MVDRYGRCVEVILLDRCDGCGPQPWLRVSYRRVLLGPGTLPGPGPGYYRTPAAALTQVDAESLVELLALPVTPARRSPID
jgi:hypothetical protein